MQIDFKAFWIDVELILSAEVWWFHEIYEFLEWKDFGIAGFSLLRW